MLIILIIIVGLSVLILGHELGHFAVAKLFKLKIDEFGFGFPPRLGGLRRYQGTKAERVSLSEEISVVMAQDSGLGKAIEIIKEKTKEIDNIKPISKYRFFWGKNIPPETDGLKSDGAIYSLNWLPFGGFVKIAGENDVLNNEKENSENLPPEEKRRLFRFQPVWRRILVIGAGVMINFAIGWFLISIVLMVGIPPALVISGVEPDSPADRVGLQTNDVIVGYAEAGNFIKFVDEHRGETVSLKINRGGEEIILNVVPRVSPPVGQGAIGVALAEIGELRQGLIPAFWEGMKRSAQISVLTLRAFYNLVKSLIFHGSLLSGVVGPVGIISVAYATGKLGLIYLIELVSIISLNLAVINLIPLPALDGGRIFLLLIEKIKGSPVSRKVELAINGLGFVFLIFLMIIITARDVAKFF